jgi:hypothetical protein
MLQSSSSAFFDSESPGGLLKSAHRAEIELETLGSISTGVSLHHTKYWRFENFNTIWLQTRLVDPADQIRPMHDETFRGD